MAVRMTLIAAVLMLVAACGKSSSPTSPSPSPSPSGATVTMVSGARMMGASAYNPNPINISRGTTITWVNNDTAPHDATSDSRSWNTGTIGPGGSASVTFETAGTFPYHCTIHPNMIGTVNVQ